MRLAEPWWTVVDVDHVNSHVALGGALLLSTAVDSKYREMVSYLLLPVEWCQGGDDASAVVQSKQSRSLRIVVKQTSNKASS